MTEEYFNEHILKCKKCGAKPLLVTENSMFAKNDDDKYRVICWSCKWEDGEYGSRTGLCKTPVNALKTWNRRFGLKEDNKDE